LGERPDVLALLLSTERGMQVLGIEGRIDIISTAAQKGDAKMVLFILQSHFNPLSDPRIRVTKPRHKRVWTKPKAFELLRTPSVEIFQIILEEMQSRKLIVLDVKLLLNYCLRYVIQRGWTDITGYLLGLGTPLNIPILGGGRVSENPLYWACKAGYKETVQVLFDAGAQISGSELGIAASRGHTSIVEMLLENGADVHAMASKDSMYAAARKGFLDIVRVLLDAGMDPNTSPPPTAPLVGAVESEHVDMFRLLVQRGAVVTRVLDEAKRMAELEGLDSMLALLSEYL
jgi:hypothetical protein